MPRDTFSMRLPEEVRQDLTDRGVRYQMPSVGAMVLNDVTTLRALKTAELSRFPLTLAEAKALAHIAPDESQGQTAGPLLAGLLVDAIALGKRRAPSFGERFGIDEDDLLQRLVALGPTADLAVRDALLTWHTHDSPSSTKTGFTSVGLHIQ